MRPIKDCGKGDCPICVALQKKLISPTTLMPITKRPEPPAARIPGLSKAARAKNLELFPKGQL